MRHRLLCVAGARPNFMKVAPLLRALRREPSFEVLLVHTGQHYDDRMAGQFFRDLEIPEPDFFLEAGSGSHAQQTAEVMKRFEPVVLSTRPEAVVVVGDVNSTLACALVAAKLQVKVVHAEAGLRSHDRTMPEEINRVLTDAITDIFLVTEESAAVNLRREGIDAAKVFLTGNLMIDSLHFSLAHADWRQTAARHGIEAGPYGLVTLHRPANVDSGEALAGILRALTEIAAGLPLYFPVHPRTRQQLAQLANPNAVGRIHLLEPLGPLDFVALMSRAALVLSDSGGIQEETTALGVPCLTLRDNTERPITVEQGSNRLAGTRYETILQAYRDHLAQPKTGRVPPLWDGHAAVRCAEVLRGLLAAGD